MLGITIQFINEASKLQSLVLAIKEVIGDHSGENMSKYVLEVLKEYDIIKNLSYFTMDNALDNDTIITALSLALRRDFRLNYDPIYYRIRY